MFIKWQRISRVVLLLALAAGSSSVHAGSKPALNGRIDGVELAPQSIAGAAVFVFEYRGRVNGRSRNGWGWIAVDHQPLNDVSKIFGGEGEIYVGWERFRVRVTGGLLLLIAENNPAIFDDDFAVLLHAQISDWRGRRCDHVFKGLLTHAVFPPKIFGSLSPD